MLLKRMKGRRMFFRKTIDSNDSFTLIEYDLNFFRIAKFKGSQLGAFWLYAIVYCYHEFKLRYLKNQKLFSIRVKELFEPIILRKKRRRVFALFKSMFLRNRSLPVMLGDFYDKKRKIGKGNLYLTENRLSWNEISYAADDHNYMCHTCAKELLLDSNLN